MEKQFSVCFILTELMSRALNFEFCPSLWWFSEVVTGPFRRRLLALARKRDGGRIKKRQKRGLRG